MGRVKTNDTSLAVTVESALGVPGTSWNLLEWDTLSDFGATLKKVSRDPISQNRQRQKGATVDLDAKVGFTADWTLSHARDFLNGFVMCKYIGPPVFVPTSVTTDYIVPSGGALPINTMVYARGFTNTANNGLKLLLTGSTATNIKAAGLVAETPPANCFLEVCGFQATAADLAIDANGNITSVALDFTTLSLSVGQAIFVGDNTVTNAAFATAVDYGYVRIGAIAAHLLTLNKRSQAFTLDTGAGKSVRLFFGQFLANQTVGATNYLEQSYTFELAYPNLAFPGPGDQYEYAMGCYANELTFNLPLANKATMTMGFVGTDALPPTSSRKTGASSPIKPVMKKALNTSSEIARVRVQNADESGLTTFFKSLTLKLNNNVSGEKALANLGNVLMNNGQFHVDIEADIMFTNGDVLQAIRDNRTVTMDWAIQNGDGGVLFDIPSLELSDGKRDFPKNQTVLLKTTGMARQDDTLGTSLGVSFFPYIPGEL